MGTLKCGNLDFNDADQIQSFHAAIQRILDDPHNYYTLAHTKKYYFCIPNVSLPEESGWYIILNGKIPVYVGKSENLNKRLNSKDGSRDNFANPQKKHDSERNFIKKFFELDLIQKSRVCVIREAQLYLEQLTDLDRSNVEKLLNIWRGIFKYL